MSVVKLKSKLEEQLAWLGAHTLFVVAEAIALKEAFNSYQHNHSLILTAVLPLLTVMPWLGGMAAVQRYKRMTEPTTQGDVKRDFSYELASVILSAYLLFIMCVVVIAR